MSESVLARMSMARLSELLENHDAELKKDDDGDSYVSIPLGQGALEIETYETPRTLFFTLHRRAWDPTGGMSVDDELAETHELYLMVALVRAELEHQSMVSQVQEQIERDANAS